MNLVDISFPGLGIETFTVNKVAFTVFGVEIRWYGILITLGMVLAFLYAAYRSRKEGFVLDNVLDLCLYGIIFGVISARLYYVVMKWNSFVLPGRGFFENLRDIVDIRSGGLAIYGGIIGGIITILVYCRVKKKNFLRACDMVAPGVMVAQALGRWGNFFNGEAHGGIVSEGHPLYFLRMGLFPNDLNTPEMAFVHPTFLYESAWNLLGFALIGFVLYPRKKFNGQIISAYLAWYGFGRMFIEGLRTDSLYLPGTGIRVSQLVGFLCFAVFGALFVVGLIRAHRRSKQGVYVPVFAEADGAAAAPAGEHAPETNEEPQTTSDATAEPADPEKATQVPQETEDGNDGEHH